MLKKPASTRASIADGSGTALGQVQLHAHRIQIPASKNLPAVRRYVLPVGAKPSFAGVLRSSHARRLTGDCKVLTRKSHVHAQTIGCPHLNYQPLFLQNMNFNMFFYFTDCFGSDGDGSKGRKVAQEKTPRARELNVRLMPPPKRAPTCSTVQYKHPRYIHHTCPKAHGKERNKRSHDDSERNSRHRVLKDE